MMKPFSTLHREIPSLSAPVEAKVLFVDLDETLAEGTIGGMTEDQQMEATFNLAVVAKIQEARAMGVQIVLTTRNGLEAIRLFESFQQTAANDNGRMGPLLTDLVDDYLPCVGGTKSDRINAYLATKNFRPDQAAFIDDNGGERSDVEENTEGVLALHPDQIGSLQLSAASRYRQRISHGLNRARPRV